MFLEFDAQPGQFARIRLHGAIIIRAVGY